MNYLTIAQVQEKFGLSAKQAKLILMNKQKKN